MKILIALALLLFAAPADAQFNGCKGGICPYPTTAAPAGYVGPKDAQSKSAYAWYSCARGYSAAYATAGGNACEICNPGDAACAIIPVGSNGKVTIPLIGGVNCATSTCTVRTIYDQSGANNCGGTACNIVATTVSNRFTVVMNALSGNACMASSGTYGSTTYFKDGFSTIAQPYTMSFVGLNSLATPGSAIGDNGNIGASTGNSNWGFYASSTLSDGASDTTSYHAFSMTASSTPRIVVDGSTTTGGTNAAGTSSWGTRLQISRDNYRNYGGNLCEVGLWAGFSTTDDGNMNTNQHGSNGYSF